ncbi:hypothetical protein K492DRAFT_189403 [Lichtheimia hyalospora FSU 10163]|nr:hypothetical protein K492DRAFT_189403 [Lichtheimia hyalospora FSU 10163]
MPLKQSKISYFIKRTPQNQEPSPTTSIENVQSAVSPQQATIPNGAMADISDDSNGNKVVSQRFIKRKQEDASSPEQHDSDSEPLFMTPRRRLKQRVKQSDDEDGEEKFDHANTSDDDDDVIIKRRPRKQDRDDSSIIHLDDGGKFISGNQYKCMQHLTKQSYIDYSEPIPKRRLLQRRIKNEETIESSQEDWKEDLDFLGENDVYEERTRGRKKSDYALALDRLKSRKKRNFEGELGPMDDYCEQVDESRSDGSDDDDTASSSIVQINTDEEQDDFVVEDDVIDGVKVASSRKDNSMVALPDAFSTSRTQKFSTNFKVYVESLVYEHFGLDTQAPSLQSSVRVVERRVGGLMESLITSDAWLPEFKEALDKYPRWIASGHCRGLICEGCRQNRPAKFQALLKLDDDDSDNEDADNSDDDQGQSFALGSECYKRANVYHQLAHFRSHISDSVRKEIESHPNIQDFIEDRVSNIITCMHSDGFMSRLYAQVQQTFRDAQLNYMKKKSTAWVTDESSEEE